MIRRILFCYHFTNDQLKHVYIQLIAGPMTERVVDPKTDQMPRSPIMCNLRSSVSEIYETENQSTLDSHDSSVMSSYLTRHC